MRRLNASLLLFLAVLSPSLGAGADFEQSLATIQQSLRDQKQQILAPGREPTAAEREKLEGRFPNLKGKAFTITGGCSTDYNCIAATVGIGDQSVWPGREAAFDAFYKEHGCLPAPEGTPPELSDVVLWAKDKEPTHASRRVFGGKFESKCGTLEKIVHDLKDLEGKSYGKPYKFYLCGSKVGLSSDLAD